MIDRGELPTTPRTRIQLVVVVQTVGCHHTLAQRHHKMMKNHDLRRNKQTDNFIEVDGGN